MHPVLSLPLLALALFLPQAGSSDLQSKPAKEKAASVSYLFPEQVTLPAGKPSFVDLHFKVADGLHVNSHTPHAEELIPTTLDIPENAGVRLAAATFPPGKDFSFAINPKEKLNVYTGEFTVQATLIATKGEHLVQGTLHYQACNNAACFPPRSIPVVFDVITK
jgi:hypothetical protein